MLRRALLLLPLLAFARLHAEPLPGTQPLTMEGDLSDRMISGVDTWLLQRIAESPAGRAHYWHRDLTSPEAYVQSVEPNRERFKRMLGVVDERVPSTLQTAREPLARAKSGFAVYRVHWPVLEGVTGEGLAILQENEKPRGTVIFLPDAGEPLDTIALSIAGSSLRSQTLVQALAHSGYDVIIPLLIDRTDSASNNPALHLATNQPNREWIYRQAFQMGRHIIGYELQKVMALADGPLAHPLAVAGYGEGGLLALYSAACDRRFEACLVSGYFQSRQELWQEPIYRNVFGLLREFGDAEIASLVAPRPLIIDEASGPRLDGPPPEDAEHKGAAAGALRSIAPEAAEKEVQRARDLAPLGRFSTATVLENSDFSQPGDAVRLLDQSLPHPPPPPPMTAADGEASRGHLEAVSGIWKPGYLEGKLDLSSVQLEQTKELERHVQRLVEDSERVRQDRFLGTIRVIQEIEKSRHFTMHKMDERPADRFTSETPKFRQDFWENVLGKLPDPSLPPNPRTRVAHENPKWTGYDVVLDVWPGVFAWGELLVPKDLKPGERRPVVVCQHGRNGVPADTVVGDKEAYNNFAATLAEQGFITFAPHNLYRGEDKYRFIQRKANSIGASMFSVIVAQHQQCLAWLKTLPFVDPQRIAFYGLSYGGESAVRIPAVLPDYCLSICSGDFNDWTRKVATTRDAHSFMFSKEWEMPYWNMGSTFSYAELTYLIFPRPFMVERGHHDMVAPDSWVASEYAKTRYVYDQFGLGDSTTIEFFNGGHTIHGVGSFEFLHKHLNWP